MAATAAACSGVGAQIVRKSWAPRTAPASAVAVGEGAVWVAGGEDGTVQELLEILEIPLATEEAQREAVARLRAVRDADAAEAANDQARLRLT